MASGNPLKTELKLFLTFFLIYSMFANYINWNENSRLDLTMAIVDEGRLTIDSYYNNTGDRAYYNGHYYSDKAPGMSFLAIPIYTVYKLIHGPPELYYTLNNNNTGGWSAVPRSYLVLMFLVTIFTSALFGALSVVLVYKTLGFFTKNDNHRMWITIGYGAGTLVLVYSTLFFGHVTATFFAFLAFYLILKSIKKKRNLYVFAGLSAGAGVLVEYTALIIVLGLLIFLLAQKKWRPSLKFALGAAIVILILLSYHKAVFDRYFVTGYNPHLIDKTVWNSQETLSIKYADSQHTYFSRLAVNQENKDICEMINNYKLVQKCFRDIAIETNNITICETITESQDRAFCKAMVSKNHMFCKEIPGKMWQTECKARVTNNLFLHIFTPIGLVRKFIREINVGLSNFLKQLVYPYKGILFFAPFIIFSIVGLKRMYRKDKVLCLFIAGITLMFLLYISSLTFWFGGSSYGVRHLLPVVPFLMIPLAYIFEKYKRILFFLILISVVLSFYGLYPHNESQEFTLKNLDNNIISYTTDFGKYLIDGPQSSLLSAILGFNIPRYLNVLVFLGIVAAIWNFDYLTKRLD